jgi:hypothetical protein
MVKGTRNSNGGATVVDSAQSMDLQPLLPFHQEIKIQGQHSFVKRLHSFLLGNILAILSQKVFFVFVFVILAAASASS